MKMRQYAPAFRSGFRCWRRLTISVLLFLLCSGCASTDSLKNANDEAVLRARVETYWAHKIRGELDKSYEFEDPFYRKKVTLVRYIKSLDTSVVKWLGATVTGIDVKEDSARVEVALKVKVRLPMIKTGEDISMITEKWVRIDGVWYHVPDGFKDRDMRGG